MPALGKQIQVDLCEFKDCLVYVVRLCLKQKQVIKDRLADGSVGLQPVPHEPSNLGMIPM